MKRLLNGMAMATLLAIATPVVAQEAPNQTQTQARGPARMAQPATEADFVSRRVQPLRAMDANNDGQLTAEERRTAAQARRLERLEQRFARLDTNSDGMISREEFSAGQQHTRGEMRGGHMRRGQMRNAMRPARAETTIDIAAAEQKAREAFARLDANSDGQVTAEERRALREAAREAGREGRRDRRAMHRGARQASPSAPVSE